MQNELVFLNSVDDLFSLLEYRKRGMLGGAHVLSYHPHVHYLIQTRFQDLQTGAEDPDNMALSARLTETGRTCHVLMERWLKSAGSDSDVSRYGTMYFYPLIRLVHAYQNLWMELEENLARWAPGKITSFVPAASEDFSQTYLGCWPVEPVAYSSLLHGVAKSLEISHEQVPRLEGTDIHDGWLPILDSYGSNFVRLLCYSGKLFRRWMLLRGGLRSIRGARDEVICFSPHMSLLLYLLECGKKPLAREMDFFDDHCSCAVDTGKFVVIKKMVESYLDQLEHARVVRDMSTGLRSMLLDVMSTMLDRGIARLRDAEPRIRTWATGLKKPGDVYFGSIFMPEHQLIASVLREAGHSIKVLQHGGSYGSFMQYIFNIELRFCDEFLCFGEQTRQGIMENNKIYTGNLGFMPPMPAKYSVIKHPVFHDRGVNRARLLISECAKKIEIKRSRGKNVVLATTALSGHLSYVSATRQRDVVEAGLQRRIIDILGKGAFPVVLYFKPYNDLIPTPYAQRRIVNDRLEIVPFTSGYFWDYVDLADIIILPTPATTLLETASSLKKKTVIVYTAADQGAICTEACKKHWPESTTTCHDMQTFLTAIQKSVSEDGASMEKDMSPFRRQFL